MGDLMLLLDQESIPEIFGFDLNEEFDLSSLRAVFASATVNEHEQKFTEYENESVREQKHEHEHKFTDYENESMRVQEQEKEHEQKITECKNESVSSHEHDIHKEKDNEREKEKEKEKEKENDNGIETESKSKNGNENDEVNISSSESSALEDTDSLNDFDDEEKNEEDGDDVTSHLNLSTISINEDDEQTILLSFFEWLRNNDGRDLISPSSPVIVKILQKDREKGLHNKTRTEMGLAAKQNIRFGETIYTLPRSLWISSIETSQSLNLDPQTYPGWYSNIAVASFLLREKSKGTGSDWYEYIRMLPTYVPVPHFYPDPLLDELQDEELAETIRTRKRYLEYMHSNLDSDDVSNANVDDFYWAMAIAWSRSFNYGHDMLIIPFADMANHDTCYNADWEVERSHLLSHFYSFHLPHPYPFSPSFCSSSFLPPSSSIPPPSSVLHSSPLNLILPSLSFLHHP